MKLIKKIKAFFRKDDEPVEMDIVAAEIREGKAFLHPKENPKKTYFVRARDIKIILDEGQNVLSSSTLTVLETPNNPQSKKDKGREIRAAMKAHEKTNASTNNHQIDGFERFQKRTVQFSLYPEEYALLTELIKETGYKQTEFIWACIQAAKRPGIEKAHNQIIKVHKRLRLERKTLIAKQLAQLEKAT